jgi:hypothetical protein
VVVLASSAKTDRPAKAIFKHQECPFAHSLLPHQRQFCRQNRNRNCRTRLTGQRNPQSRFTKQAKRGNGATDDRRTATAYDSLKVPNTTSKHKRRGNPQNRTTYLRTDCHNVRVAARFSAVACTLHGIASGCWHFELGVWERIAAEACDAVPAVVLKERHHNSVHFKRQREAILATDCLRRGLLCCCCETLSLPTA